MNKKTMNKVISLFRDGASEEICIALILDLLDTNTSSIEKGIAIHTFYESVFDLSVKQL